MLLKAATKISVPVKSISEMAALVEARNNSLSRAIPVSVMTVLQSATGANGGTPGYQNGAVKEKVADLSDAEITISEIMVDVGESRQNLAQWIELYNSSMTQAVTPRRLEVDD